ncbi:MAG: carboxypeptidase regulatory-like domain-containing protein [Bacteroidaceae bacterium]|nr:carboxypeptidase regulatory-like domain-containing protein [Bacteroidaceae bacterium]
MKKLFYTLPLFIVLLMTACEEELPETMGGIYGIVSNSETGEPVRGASVVLSPGNQTTVTGHDGHFEFSNLAAGQYKLQASASGYNTNSRQITVVAGENASGDMPLSPIAELMNVRLSNNHFDFGSSHSELALTIQNTGNSGAVDWIITGVDAAWLTVSPTNGSIAMGKTADVKLVVDRNKLTTDEASTTFMVNAAGGSQSVRVNVSKKTADGGDTDNDNSSGDGGNSSIQDVTGGLYAYYTFENNTNNVAEGGYNAAAINNPTYVESMNGTKAIKFSSSNNSSITIPEAMIDGCTFTVSFWAKGLSDGHIFSVPSSGSYDTSFDLVMLNGSLAYTVRGANIDYAPKFTHSTFNASEWSMITLTSEKNGISAIAKLYVNGVYMSSLKDIMLDYSLNQGLSFTLGGKLVWNGGTRTINAVNMTVDNLRIYNGRALSIAEVMQVYNYESQ